MPTNSPERHIYVQQWLNWVTMYAESWLSSLITVAIQTGTMNANDDANYNENFLAKRLFEHFEAVEDEYFDEIYTPENGHILLEQNRKREIDTFTTKSAQEQQQIVEKIVGKSLAICHILLKLAKEASQANENFLTTIYSKTLQQLSHKSDHTKRYEHLAQYFGTISFFYGQIYKALIVAQNWLKPSVKFDQRLTELKQECEDATNELAKTNPKLAENNSIKNLLLNNDGIKNLTKTFHDIKSIVNSPKNLSRGSRKAEENGGAIEMIEFDDDLKNLENNEDDVTQTDTVDFMGNWVWID
ncbi:hypothetical protein niasHS_008495 [Heterodera schachtii]|uniref:Uncharacterized protein n=1 Tax=Heterodera schachtii TaxID=97005 RepID=A0ABD2JET2_HETSC